MRRGGEKREHERFIKRCETEFIVDGITHRGVSSNLSMNGLYINANRPFSPDTVIDITVHLPNGKTSILRGRVERALKGSLGNVIAASVKSLKSGMGVKLLEKDNNYIEFINSRLPD